MNYICLVSLFVIVLSGCSSKDSGAPVSHSSQQTTTSEADLYFKGKSSAGFVYYKHSMDTIAKAGGSGHSQPRLRTRYNAVAAEALDAAGKVKTGSVFRDSSLIVKELYSGSTLDILVFLYKKKGDANADANGWIWAETSPTGSSIYPANLKGAGCIGCHSTGIDYTRMNDAHP